MTPRVWAGLTWKNSNSKEKGMTEDNMVGWHHRLNEHELEQTLGDGEGQGSLACCPPRGHKELTMNEQLNTQVKERKKIPATEKGKRERSDMREETFRRWCNAFGPSPTELIAATRESASGHSLWASGSRSPGPRGRASPRKPPMTEHILRFCGARSNIRLVLFWRVHRSILLSPFLLQGSWYYRDEENCWRGHSWRVVELVLGPVYPTPEPIVFPLGGSKTGAFFLSRTESWHTPGPSAPLPSPS